MALFYVIPAEAGIHASKSSVIPEFRGFARNVRDPGSKSQKYLLNFRVLKRHLQAQKSYFKGQIFANYEEMLEDALRVPFYFPGSRVKPGMTD